MFSTPAPESDALGFALRAMLSSVARSPWWTQEPDPSQRLSRLSDCASAFAQASSLAYPQSGAFAWSLAGEAVRSEVGADEILSAAFSEARRYAEAGPQLSMEATKTLAMKMQGFCSNSEQRSGLLAGLSGLSSLAKTPASRGDEGDDDDEEEDETRDNGSWMRAAQEAVKRFEIIERNRSGQATHQLQKAKSDFQTENKKNAAVFSPGGRPEAFAAGQLAMALNAQTIIEAGPDQDAQGLALAIAVAQNCALAKDPSALGAFDAALNAIESLMERERAHSKANLEAQTLLIKESSLLGPPKRRGKDASIKARSFMETRRALTILQGGEESIQMNERFRAQRLLLNHAASFWIGALAEDPALEPLATRFLKVALGQEPPEPSSESQNARCSRQMDFEGLRWAWARAGCGPDPDDESFERFSSGSGWSLKAHHQQSLWLFKDAEHAACSLLNDILAAMATSDLDASKTIRALQEIERSQSEASTSTAPHPSLPLLAAACEEGLQRLCAHFLSVGQGDRWLEINHQLKSSCAAHWSAGNEIDLSRASQAGQPVHAIAAVLASGTLSHDAALLAKMSDTLTASRDRLVATLEAQELRESIGKSLPPRRSSSLSL